ncbi:protein sgcE [Providencia alcalifaciens]|nr:protein sgcE [Providencia alcalifaciens]
MIIHPSLASADPLRLGDIMDNFANEEIGSLHLDIEDGNFISNITFGLKVVKAVSQVTKHALSIHLMVVQPAFWIRELAPFSPKWIFFHPEVVQNPSEIIAEIKKIGVKAGLALNPATQFEPYQYLIEQFDAVMVMTSEPDGHHQQFISNMKDKIQKITQMSPKLACWVDGDVNLDNITILKKAGATHCVVGRSLFSNDNYAITLEKLRH